MKKRKLNILLCVALAATVALFICTEGSAQTNTTIAGWNVSLTAASNTYTYKFTQTTGDKVSFVEILFPKELNEGSLSGIVGSPYTNIKTYLNDIDIPYDLILGPTGDGSTGFGIGLPNYNVLKIKSDSARSFPLGSFILKIEVSNQIPPTNFVLGASPSVMLVKSGNGQVWGSNLIDAPAFVPVPPPPPPIGIDTEFLSVEGHPEYAIRLKKDLYGNFTEVCLVDGFTKDPVKDGGIEPDCCTTEGLFVCNVGETTITLNLDDVNNVPLYMCVGDPANGGVCTPWKYTAKETEGKSGENTCGWKLLYGRYMNVCW